MNYGIGNVKAKVSGGDANLNIAYGLTPPSDTTKLWVRTDKEISDVIITENPTWSDVLESETISSQLENIYNQAVVRAGEYVYFIGGKINGISTNKISRYNTITNEFEDLGLKLPFNFEFSSAVCYKDYIYMYGGKCYTGSITYSQPNMLKFNWKTNKIVASAYYNQESLGGNGYPSYFYSSGYLARVGKEIFVIWNCAPAGATPLPNSSITLLKTYAGSSNYTQTRIKYLIDKDKFELVDSDNDITNFLFTSVIQKINKTALGYGGYYTNYSSGRKSNFSKQTNIDDTINMNVNKTTVNLGGRFGEFNIVLTTNTKLFVCGGLQGNSSSNATQTNACFYVSYDALTTPVDIAHTLPITASWLYGQFDEQTSYGRSGTYFVKVQNKMLLEENKLMIIPDVFNDDEYTLSTIEGVDLKTSIQNVYVGNSNGKAEMVRVYQCINGKWRGINCDDYIPQTKVNYSFNATWYDVATNTSATSCILCNVGDLIVASVIARDSGNEVVSEGWTLLGRSQVGELNQTLAFYYKIATSECETITITQSSSSRIYISMVSFAGKTTATMGTFSFNTNTSIGQIELPQDDRLCLVSASCNLWNTNSPYPIYEYSDNDADMVYYGNYHIQGRLGTWVDNKGGTKTITAPLGEPTTNTLIIGYVEIS